LNSKKTYENRAKIFWRSRNLVGLIQETLWLNSNGEDLKDKG
jgi:hypothetical protein